MDDNFSVQEEGGFNDKVPSLKEIILLHIKKISGICCGEFSKGYWEERPIKVGGGIAIMRRYRPDQRAAFSNAVDFLLWLVYPLSDDTFKNKYKPEDNKEEKTEDNKEEKVNWEKILKERKEIFREINLMFERTNFFDMKSGQTEK